MLTGTGIQIGSATEFDASIRFPRGMASDGTTLLLFDASQGYTLNPMTGVVTSIGSLTHFDVSENQVRAACWNGTNFVFYGNSRRRLYTYDPEDGSVTDLTGELSIQGLSTDPDVWGLAFLDGMYWALERNTDALYNITGNELVRVGSATDYGLTGSPNIQAFTAYKGELIAASNALERLVRFNRTTGVATVIADNALPDRSPEALAEHDGTLLMAGSAADALFRLYDVLWDETIDAIEVDEGGNGRLDLSTVSEDATSFEFAPGHTARSWLTISGMDLTVTNAPDVAADIDFEAVVRAIRDGVHADKTLTVRVIAAAAPPPSNPPTFTEPATNHEVNERANGTIDSTEFFTGHTRLAFRSGYSAPSWLTVSGLNVVITDAPDVLEATDFTVPLTATNGNGSVNGSITISVQQIDPAPIFLTPNRFDIDEGSSSVFDLSGDLQHTESLAYQSGYSAPSWLTISGLTLVITNAEQVSQDTDFDVLLAAESTKTAATADRTVTIRVRDVAVPPPPEPPPPEPKPEPPTITPTLPNDPTDLKVELTPTTALLKWAAATEGGDAEAYEVNVAEGASLGSTWIGTGSTNTRFFVKRLKRGTQYTFGVRGRNSEGAGEASSPVTQNTPIASLHNALFFKECVNYFDDGARVSVHGNPSELVRAVADNNYKTFTREKDLVINIAVGGNPTRVDAILVKGQDIEGHSAEPTGGTGSGYSNRMMPATVKNWEGTDVSTVVAGFQHDLYLLDSHFTATSVRLTFTGANAKITEIMLLEFGLEIDSNADFTQINPDFVDRSGVVHPDPGGGISYTPPLGGGRDRWQIDYAVKVVPGKTLLETPEDFLYWRSENRNHVHAQEFTRFPWRVFPAVFLGKSVPVRYRTDDKTGGEILNFRVAEQ